VASEKAPGDGGTLCSTPSEKVKDGISVCCDPKKTNPITTAVATPNPTDSHLRVRIHKSQFNPNRRDLI
jgi:hypothetical protein